MWCPRLDAREGVSGAKVNTVTTAHASVVNTVLTLQTPRATENQRLEARICYVLGACHRVTTGKRGWGTTMLASMVLGARKQRELLPV